MRRLPATTVYYGLEFLLSAPSWIFIAVYLVRDLEFSPLELILMGTVMEATIFLTEIPTGVIADTFSRRASLIVSMVIQGAAITLVGVFTDPIAVIATWGLWGFGWTFMSGAYEAWITDEVGSDRVGPVFLRGNRVGYLGGLAGLGAQTALALYSLQAAVIAGGVLTIACGLASLLFMPETGWTRRPRAERSHALAEFRTTAVQGGRFVRAQPLLLLLLAITFFAGMSSEAFDRLSEAHFIRDVGLPSIGALEPIVWFGILGAIGLAISFVGAGFLLKRFEGERPPALARTLLLLTAVLLVAQLVFALSGVFAVAVVGFLVARLGRSLIGPVYMTWLNQQITDSSVRATVISISGQADAVGQAAGGPMLGVIGNAWGIRAALSAGALVLAPALALYGRALRHGGREPELENLPQPAPV
ncbi:MAG: MFS transporter [Gaiellaceae bacterium]